MKKTIILMIILFCSICVSCSDEEFIYYKYNDVTITRIQNGVENNLYYGYFTEDDSLPESYIKTYYRGWDGGMGGLLIFNEDRTVKVIRTYGFFDHIGEDSSIFLSPYIDNIIFCKFSDSIDGNYNNIIEISGGKETEIFVNKKYNHTKVTAIYPE